MEKVEEHKVTDNARYKQRVTKVRHTFTQRALQKVGFLKWIYTFFELFEKTKDRLLA